MSTDRGQWVVAMCDYCGAQHGKPGDFSTSVEARESAAKYGWVVLGGPRDACDACPNCKMTACSHCKGNPPVGYICTMCSTKAPPPRKIPARCARCHSETLMRVNGKVDTHRNPSGRNCLGTRDRGVRLEP